MRKNILVKCLPNIKVSSATTVIQCMYSATTVIQCMYSATTVIQCMYVLLLSYSVCIVLLLSYSVCIVLLLSYSVCITVKTLFPLYIIHISVSHYSLFTFTLTSKLGCDDFICNIVYSLIS